MKTSSDKDDLENEKHLKKEDCTQPELTHPSYAYLNYNLQEYYKKLLPGTSTDISVHSSFVMKLVSFCCHTDNNEDGAYN